MRCLVLKSLCDREECTRSEWAHLLAFFSGLFHCIIERDWTTLYRLGLDWYWCQHITSYSLYLLYAILVSSFLRKLLAPSSFGIIGTYRTTPSPMLMTSLSFHKLSYAVSSQSSEITASRRRKWAKELTSDQTLNLKVVCSPGRPSHSIPLPYISHRLGTLP